MNKDVKDGSYVKENGYAGPERRRFGRENGNGRDWTSLRAWANAIGIIGIPGAIALGVTYVGATYIPRILEQQLVLIAKSDQLLEKTGELIKLQNEMLRLRKIEQRLNCYNSARDENAKRNCLSEQ